MASNNKDIYAGWVTFNCHSGALWWINLSYFQLHDGALLWINMSYISAVTVAPCYEWIWVTFICYSGSLSWMNINYFQLLQWLCCEWIPVTVYFQLSQCRADVNAHLDVEMTYKQTKQVLGAFGFRRPKKSI